MLFRSDTAAALRAIELECNILIKGTKVDGVYDADPKLNPGARRYADLSYQEALKQGLRVMDGAALALCGENNMPILVFDLMERGGVERIVLGETVGTTVHNLDTPEGFRWADA